VLHGRARGRCRRRGGGRPDRREAEVVEVPDAASAAVLIQDQPDGRRPRARRRDHHDARDRVPFLPAARVGHLERTRGIDARDFDVEPPTGARGGHARLKDVRTGGDERPIGEPFTRHRLRDVMASAGRDPDVDALGGAVAAAALIGAVAVVVSLAFARRIERLGLDHAGNGAGRRRGRSRGGRRARFPGRSTRRSDDDAEVVGLGEARAGCEQEQRQDEFLHCSLRAAPKYERSLRSLLPMADSPEL
jgi:hypothetical protein